MNKYITDYIEIKSEFLNLLRSTAPYDHVDYILNRFSINEVFWKSICLLPFWVDYCIEKTSSNLEKNYLKIISTANLHACLAYTIYDYIRDNKLQQKYLTTSLSIANILLHKSILSLYHCAKSLNTQYLITDLCNTIDTFYLEEENLYKIPALNQNNFLTQFKALCSNSYKKSIGMAITALMTLEANGYSSDSGNYKLMLDFFKNYLNARQLSDDHDDIEEDIINNILTPGTFLVKNNFCSVLESKRLLRVEIDLFFNNAQNSLDRLENFNSALFKELYVANC